MPVDPVFVEQPPAASDELFARALGDDSGQQVDPTKQRRPSAQGSHEIDLSLRGTKGDRAQLPNTPPERGARADPGDGTVPVVLRGVEESQYWHRGIDQLGVPAVRRPAGGRHDPRRRHREEVIEGGFASDRPDDARGAKEPFAREFGNLLRAGDDAEVLLGA